MVLILFCDDVADSIRQYPTDQVFNMLKSLLLIKKGDYRNQSSSLFAYGYEVYNVERRVRDIVTQKCSTDPLG